MAKEKPARLRALDHAKSQLGVKENPAGSNWSPIIKNYLASTGLNYPKPPGVPWCAAFVCWCYEKAGLKLTFPNRASVGYFELWALAHGYLVDRPYRGDVVCYRFDEDNWPDHIGIIERVLAVRWSGRTFVGLIRTIEGNTSAGNDANGGQVQRRIRWAHRCKFARIL